MLFAFLINIPGLIVHDLLVQVIPKKIFTKTHLLTLTSFKIGEFPSSFGLFLQYF